jgi:hypothetical protein
MIAGGVLAARSFIMSRGERAIMPGSGEDMPLPGPTDA